MKHYTRVDLSRPILVKFYTLQCSCCRIRINLMLLTSVTVMSFTFLLLRSIGCPNLQNAQYLKVMSRRLLRPVQWNWPEDIGGFPGFKPQENIPSLWRMSIYHCFWFPELATVNRIENFDSGSMNTHLSLFSSYSWKLKQYVTFKGVTIPYVQV